MRSDREVLDALHPLLFGWHHEGIRRGGDAYPLGGFLSVAVTIDVLAGLAYNPQDDADRRRGARYKAFVQRFFPPAYARLPDDMWDGLRSAPVHYMAATKIVFTDSQPDSKLHLRRDGAGRVVLHWPEFFSDYEQARDRYWAALKADTQLLNNARGRLARRPLMVIGNVDVEVGISLPTALPARFPNPTGMQPPSS